MKFVIQRVTGASVTVDNEIIGKIGKGFLVLIGISQTDTKEIADKLIRKMTGLRIFDDENGKTNLARRKPASYLTVHAVRRLPQGLPSLLYKRRLTRYGKRTV